MNKNSFALKLVFVLLLVAISVSILEKNVSKKYREMYPAAYAVSSVYHQKLADNDNYMIKEEHQFEETRYTERIDGVKYYVETCPLCGFNRPGNPVEEK